MEETTHLIKFKSLEYTRDLIKDKSVYLNSPFNFNDPLDSYFIQLFGKNKEDMPISLQKYIDLSKEIHIFCGTFEKNLENVLLWSHYGNFHKGVALKYKIPKVLEGNLRRVEYGKHDHIDFMEAINYGNPLNLPSTTLEEKDKNIINSVFLKDKEWEYEQEIRYVKKIKNKENALETGWEIEEVYLGCKILDSSDKDLEEILRLVELCKSKQIKIFEMTYEYDEKKRKMCLNKSKWITDRKYFRD